jgi:hypothetical protein
MGDITMTEAEWRDLDDLRKHWRDFCDCDFFEGYDTFPDRMEERGYITLRSVTRRDLDESFAAERGIVKGGTIWVLTEKGRAAMEVGK